MRDATRALGLTLAALALVGCFPDDYRVGEDAPPAQGMIRMYSEGETFSFVLDGEDHTTSFSYDFDLDATEVTVDDFRAWWDDSHPLPCNGCALDVGGPYEESLLWSGDWNLEAERKHFTYGTDGSAQDGVCPGPKQYPLGDASPPSSTWEMDQANDTRSYPATCVSWVQAAAYCASRNKRLPTVAEWMWARTEGGSAKKFPWGSADPTCADATIDGEPSLCGFPKDVGSQDRDTTESGVKDLVGSVFEWAWDGEWADGPLGKWDYAGPAVSYADDGRMRLGGSFINGASDQELYTKAGVFGAFEAYNDAGFRCAKTVAWRLKNYP